MRRPLLTAILALVPMAAVAARSPHLNRVKAVSWNRAISCTPYTATANDVLEGRFGPGLGDPAAASPPCSNGHTSTFVLMHRMRIIGPLGRACPAGETVYCDTIFTVEDPVAPSANRKPQRIRCVIDQAWKRAAIAPPDPGREEVAIEIQGFVHRDPATGAWEIHPVTAWR